MIWNGLELPDRDVYHAEDAAVIYCADCRDILPLLPKVDLVLTDPPYGVGKAEWDGNDYWRELIQMVLGHLPLKDDGILITFCSTRYLADTISYIPIPYRWQFIAYSPNNMIPGDIGFAKYTSALIFSRRKSIHTNAKDLRECMAGITELKEINHPTAKPISIMAYLIEHFSKKDETILDPFLGSGTTAVAAKHLGRKCIGIEIEEQYCKIAVDRLRQSVMGLEV